MFKVLIVEDEEMIRKGLRYTFDWIKEDCIVIDEASNGQEGAKKIIELKPDIVFADVNMPIMDGISMIENTIKKVIYSAIIISGYDEFHLAKKAIHLGVSEYLVKPVDPKQMREAIEAAKKQVELKKQYEILKNSSNNVFDIEVLNADLMKGNHTASKYVLKMIKFVQEKYNKKISIQDLVKILNVSSTYLNQKFKSETSYTFNEFVNRYRVQRAIDIMKTGKGKIYTIASDVGFKDYKYFISIFKKYVNCAPSQFLDYFRKVM